MVNNIFGVTISYLNDEGIHDKVFRCKLTYLEKYLNSDIKILTETWGICICEKNSCDHKKPASPPPENAHTLKKCCRHTRPVGPPLCEKFLR